MEIKIRSDMGVKVLEQHGSEHSIVNAARISLGNDDEMAPKEPVSSKADLGLLKRLLKDKHGTPFEKAGYQLKLEVPIFVAHQVQRHRWSSFNEQSGRYSDFQPVFYMPYPHRQGGKRMDYIFEAMDDEEATPIGKDIVTSYTASYMAYTDLLERGLAREQARMVLPTSIYTAVDWTINIRSLCNFLALRLDAHAQYEIRVLAQEIFDNMEKDFPNITRIYREVSDIPVEEDIGT